MEASSLQQSRTIVKDWRTFPASLIAGEDRAQVRLLRAEIQKRSLTSVHAWREKRAALCHTQNLFFPVLKCTGVMYFPCYFLELSLRDMSLNPISGYIPLKCYSESLNMFYK